MNSNKNLVGFLCVCAVAVFLLSMFLLQRPTSELNSKTPPSTPVEAELSRPGYVKIGGVWRPEKDVIKLENDDIRASRLSIDPGRSPVVSVEESASVSTITKSMNDSELLKNRTSFGQADEFDVEEYRNDPEAYLSEIVPGRVWQVLAAGENVPRIEVEGKNFAKLVQGESAILKARSEPGMPVTFYSDKLGQFQNRLNVVSVAADENGIAAATFRATGGTRGQINIIAASPVRSGHAKFLVKVTPPITR